MNEVKPKKSDSYDHEAVIKYAAQKAAKSGKSWYVVAMSAKWVAVKDQPSPRWSHWKVDGPEEIYAHYLGGLDTTEYSYEKTSFTV